MNVITTTSGSASGPFARRPTRYRTPAFAADHHAGMIWGKVLRSRIRTPASNRSTLEGGGAARREGVVTSRDIVDFPIDKSSCSASGHALDVRNVMARRRRCSPAPGRGRRGHVRGDRGKGCELIEVEYEVLPWSVEIEDALLPRADPARLHEVRGQRPTSAQDRVKKGDIAEGFAAAEIVIERSFATRRCIRAISSRMPASSASAPTTRPRSGARARASSWCAP